MSEDRLSVLPVGSRTLIRGDIKAIITGIMIHGKDHIQYECSWWNGESRTSAWLDATEIDAGDMIWKEVGFLTK